MEWFWGAAAIGVVIGVAMDEVARSLLDMARDIRGMAGAAEIVGAEVAQRAVGGVDRLMAELHATRAAAEAGDDEVRACIDRACVDVNRNTALMLAGMRAQTERMLAELRDDCRRLLVAEGGERATILREWDDRDLAMWTSETSVSEG